MCAIVWRHLVKATEVTSVLAWQKVMAAYHQVDGLKLMSDYRYLSADIVGRFFRQTMSHYTTHGSRSKCKHG